MHTHTRSHVHILIPASLSEIEFSLRHFNFISDETPFKIGLPMIPNQEKKCKNKIKIEN